MKISKNFLSAFLVICILAGLLPAEEALADFDPMPGGTGILGQVLDEKTGLPPESVTATLRYDDESGVIIVDEKKTVDADGKFLFTYHNEGSEFPAGNYTLTFTSPFYLTKVEQIRITDNAQASITQTYLTPGGSIFGTVTDAQTGAALAGVTVRSTSGGNAATTNEAGEYRLELEAGTRTIEFAKENYQTATLTRAFGPGTEPHIGADDVRLTLESGGNVEIIASGDCGANSGVTWTLDSNGLLSILGKGVAIPDFTISENPNYNQPAPWYSWRWRELIHTIAIENGIIGIGNRAFYGCSNLTSVTISDSVTYIGSSAFSGCSSLTSVTIPDSLTHILGWTFEGCKGLTSVIIPDSVTGIGAYAFEGCSSLTSVTIPDSVTSIGSSAFRGCSSLTSVTIPDSVTSIGSGAFWNCSNLTSVTIPDSVTSINGVFSGCSSLTGVTIPDSVISIDGAFDGCSSLTRVTIPDSVTNIGWYAFGRCSGLTSITIPDSVTNIGDGAFSSCSSLTSVIIPSNVTTIGDSAFYDCSNLTSVTIPDSVTSIGEGAFYCNLTDVYYLGNEAQWKAISIGTNNSPLTNATIHYNSAGPKEGFRVSANTATTCLKKGTTFEMDVAYFKNDKIDLTAKEFIAISGNSDVLGITAGSWDDATGRRYIVTAKQAGSGSITFTNPSDGQANKIDFTVIDGESGYTFDRVPKMTIEEDKTTNFYNFCGMVVDDFAYTPHKDENGVIDYYDVTMTVYNSKNLYGTAASYQSNGEIYECAVIDEHSDFSTSFVGDLKELKNSIGDLFYLLGNEKYYSGKSISKKTPISIKVPAGGYLQISNSLSSETATVANVIGLLVDGTARVSGLVSSSSDFVDKTTNITSAVLNESMKTIEEVLADDFLKKQVSGELKKTVQKAYKTGTWNLDNYGECMNVFLGAFSDLGVDLAKNIAKKVSDAYDVLSVTESVVKRVIPTGNLINFMYNTVGMMDQSLFWVNFQASASFPSGIFIYAPSTSSSYQSNGVNVTPAQKDNHVTVHAYRVVDTADVSGNKYETYSVNMYRDGQKVQPDAPVSVQIPLMPSYNKGSVKVYRINDDGTTTNMNATVENGYAVFTTDHFSYYALVDVDTNGVFLSRWTSKGRSVVTLSDPDEAANDAIVCAATYDDDGRMTDVMFGERFESGANQIQVAFPGELGEGWELYILAPDHAPICPGMTLQAPSKG